MSANFWFGQAVDCLVRRLMTSIRPVVVSAAAFDDAGYCHNQPRQKHVIDERVVPERGNLAYLA
jgi:hypothetical protein